MEYKTLGRVWADNRSALGAKKAIDLVKAGANLRLQKKLDTMDYESQMRSWLTEPVDSDSDDDDDDEEDGARPAGGAYPLCSVLESLHGTCASTQPALRG